MFKFSELNVTSSSGLNDLSCFLTRNFATNPKSINTATAMPVTIKNLFIRTTLYGFQNKGNKLKTFFESLLKITGNGLFLRVKKSVYGRSILVALFCSDSSFYFGYSFSVD